MKRVFSIVLVNLFICGLIFLCQNTFAAGGKGNVKQLGKKVYIWRFDEGSGKETKDSTDGIVGKIVGNVKWADGISGKCLEFSGKKGDAQYVEVAHCDQVDIDEQITMSAWVYPEILPTGGQENKFTIFYKNTYYMQLEPGDGKSSQIAYYFYEANPEGYHLSDDKVTKTKEWTHVAVVWNGKEVSYYINGNKDKKVINQSGVGKSSAAHVLRFGGENNDCCPRFFQGRIDNITLANYAFSEDEIRSMSALAVDSKDKLSITWGMLKQK